MLYDWDVVLAEDVPIFAVNGIDIFRLHHPLCPLSRQELEEDDTCPFGGALLLDDGEGLSAGEFLLGDKVFVASYLHLLCPRGDRVKKVDISLVEGEGEDVPPYCRIPHVVAEEAHAVLLFDHFSCALGVDLSHFLHTGEEAVHEAVIVTVCPWNVVEIHRDALHDIKVARSARVDLHALKVAPDELSKGARPVVVVVHGVADLLGRAEEFKEVARREVGADEGPDFWEDCDHRDLLGFGVGSLFRGAGGKKKDYKFKRGCKARGSSKRGCRIQVPMASK